MEATAQVTPERPVAESTLKLTATAIFTAWPSVPDTVAYTAVHPPLRAVDDRFRAVAGVVCVPVQVCGDRCAELPTAPPSYPLQTEACPGGVLTRVSSLRQPPDPAADGFVLLLVTARDFPARRLPPVVDTDAVAAFLRTTSRAELNAVFVSAEAALRYA